MEWGHPRNSLPNQYQYLHKEGKKKSLKTSALNCTSTPYSESFPAKTHPLPACPSQPLHDTLPPAPDSHEASGMSCVSLAARPGSHCPGEPSPWRSRRTRCGTQAGTGNSAGPGAWGAGKSACLQHRFRRLQPHQTWHSLFLPVKPL